MGKVISIANQKGGVGKTTTTINLGAALVRENKKVLIIDLDEQSNTSIGLGLKRELIDKTSYDVLTLQASINESIVTTSVNNLIVLPASSKLCNVEKIMYTDPLCYKRLYNALNDVKDDYDYILLDCPPSLGLIVDNALYASDSVIIPVECEFFAYDALTQMAHKIRESQKIKKTDGLNLTIEGVLLTKFDNRNLIGYKIKEKVIKMFPKKTFQTVINKSSQVQEAPMYGKSVIEFSYNSRGSKEYRELAKEILKNNEA